MTSRKEKMDEITSMLEDGVKDIFESGAYENYLKVMSRFHKYSPRNTLLIALQKPDATLVAGYHSWRKNFKRYVRRGEQAIEILAPMQIKKVVENPDKNLKESEEEKIITTYRPAYVFDVSQTEGEPLPVLAKTLDGSVDNYNAFLDALIDASPVPVEFQNLHGPDGYFSLTDKMIVINDGMSEPQTLAALVHEITHAMLHDRNLKDAEEKPETLKDGRTKEVEAESVAYAVCQYFGIETGENSFGYIASWSKNKELGELYASLDTIRSTASDIIEKTEKNLNKDKNKEITRDGLLQVCEPSFFYFAERGKER